MVGFESINEESREIARQCVAVVEATSCEFRGLWERHSPQATPKMFPIDSWEDRLGGGMFEVGKINDRPIVVEYRFSKINSKWVMFYNGCSALVDHNMIEEWLKKSMGHAKSCDSMNFHQAIRHIDRLIANEVNKMIRVKKMDQQSQARIGYNYGQ